MGENEPSAQEMLLIEFSRLENQIRQEIDTVINNNTLSEDDVRKMNQLQQKRSEVLLRRKQRNEGDFDFLQKQINDLKTLLQDIQNFFPN